MPNRMIYNLSSQKNFQNPGDVQYSDFLIFLASPDFQWVGTP